MSLGAVPKTGPFLLLLSNIDFNAYFGAGEADSFAFRKRVPVENCVALMRLFLLAMSRVWV